MVFNNVTNPQDLLARADECQRQGQVSDAEALYRQVLADQPRHPDAHHNLAVLLKQSARLAEALPHFKQALEAWPQAPQFWLSYAQALRESSQLADAAQVIALGRQKGLDGAAVDVLEALIQEGLAQQRDIAALVANKATLPPADLAAQAEALLARHGPQARLQQLLGEARLKLQDNAGALEVLTLAVQALPLDANVWNQKGLAEARLKRFEASIASYLQALALAPDNVDLLANLASTLTDAKRPEEALPHLKKALALNPASLAAQVNYANTLGALGRYAEGIASLKPLIDAGTTLPEAVTCYANLLTRGGRASEALQMMRQIPQVPVLKLDTDISLSLMLPTIYDSVAAIEAWRAHYQANIDRLLGLTEVLDEPSSSWGSFYFYLAYHHRNDRPIVESLCTMLRARVQALNYVAPQLATARERTGDGRIRVGFLSEFLVNHTIGKLYQGFIRHLDRQQFEVTVIHAPEAKQDAFRTMVDQLADHSVSLPASLPEAQQRVAALELDVLFYPDIGMSAFTYFLAFARLAPVQAVSWGHPDTTGLDTLDYFVSAASIEPEGAEAHYTERLIKLNRLPCFYQPTIAPSTIKPRAALGLPEQGVLYGCPQSLFKLHPDFDAVLAEIVEGDPSAHVILLEGPRSGMTEPLRARWAQTHPILLERVLILPRLPLDDFMMLMAHINVLLDPIYFGSGNSLYESMVYGTPVVSWAGDFMRGRIVAGAYQQLGIQDAPVVSRIEDYAPLALALGRDPARRKAYREAAIRVAAKTLYADFQAVREFEQFLLAATTAARHGQKLPSGWMPVTEPSPVESTPV